MGSVSKQTVEKLVEGRDNVALLSLFDDDPDAVRRALIRLAYDPHAPLHDATITALAYLSEQRSESMQDFFLETMRRQIWAMNEEGGNISWSAPEIVAAVIAGNPKRFSEFFSFAYYAAIDELVFQPSLVKAYDMVTAKDASITEEFAASVEQLRTTLQTSEQTYLSYS